MAFDDPNKPIQAKSIQVTDDVNGTSLSITSPLIAFGTSNPDETGDASIFAGGNNGSSVLRIGGAPQVGNLNVPQLSFTNYSSNFAGGTYPNGYSQAELSVDEFDLRSQSDAVNDLKYDGTKGTIRHATEVWTAIPFAGTWGDVAGARAAYYIDAVGMVHVRGQVVGGGSAVISNAIPAPTQSQERVTHIAGSATLCAVMATTGGVLQVTVNAATAQTTGCRIDMDYPLL